MRVVLALLGLSLAVTPAYAQRCMVRALAETGAVEDATSRLPAGKVFGPITEVRVGKRLGGVSYCSHGSYCYPAKDLRMITDCHVDDFSSFETDDYKIFDPH